MKKDSRLTACFLTLISLASFAFSFHSSYSFGQTALRPLPPVFSDVADETETLNPSEGQALANKLSEIEKKTNVKIIVLIATTVHPETIEAYVQRLVNHWEEFSGLLSSGRYIFVVVAKNDRAVRVVPGQQFAWVLEPFSASGIMSDTAALLRRGNYFEALAAIADNV